MAIYLHDKGLVKQLLGGDERAFDRFFEENFARLYRFALARLSDDPDAAREVAQITLTRAIRKLHTYRPESALFTWPWTRITRRKRTSRTGNTNVSRLCG